MPNENRPYEPHTWVTGELITAEKMNKLEQAIKAVDEDIYSGEGTVSERMNEIVKVSETQPVSGYNKVWAQPSTEDGVVVPTEAELETVAGIIANPFATNQAYAIGEYVIYSGSGERKLYKFTSAHEAGSWKAWQAEEVVLGDEVLQLNNHMVRWDSAQSLTNAQKEQARENIDAAGEGDVIQLQSAFDAYQQSPVYPEDTSFFDSANILDFASVVYDSAFTVSGVSVTKCTRSVRVTNNSGNAVSIFLAIPFPSNGNYFANFVYTQTQINTNVRFFEGTGTLIAGIYSGTTCMLTNIDSTKTYNVRLYLVDGEDLNITSATITKDGAKDYLKNQYLNKESSDYWDAQKASGTLVWNTGSINSNGTIDTSATTLRYSSAFPVYLGRTYAMDNSNDIAAIKLYNTNPTIGTTVPTQSISGTVTEFESTIDGYAVIIVAASYVSDTIISTFNMLDEIDSAADSRKVGDKLDELKSTLIANAQEPIHPESTDFFDGANLIDFLSNTCDTAFNVPAATILRGHRSLRIVNNGVSELTIFIPITFKVNGTHFGLFQYTSSQQNTNIRLYKGSTVVAGFGNSLVTINNVDKESSYTIRFYLGIDEDLNISSAEVYSDGSKAYLKEEYLNKDSQTYWMAKRVYSLAWNVGSIKGDGTIDSTVTTLRYSSAFPVFTGRTYAMDNGRDIIVIKLYNADPVIGTTVPTQSLNNRVTEFESPIDGYAVIIVAASDVSATVISTFNVLDAMDKETGISGIPDASATDAGKSLLVKTVNNGKVTEWEYGINTVERRIVVEQQEIVNSVQKEVIETQIEEVSGARFASLHGVLPSNTAAENTAALQALLDDGGTVIVDVPGTYTFAECLMIGSNTSLICFNGVYFKQDNTGGIILNKGALTKEYDTNITIKGLNFIDGNHAGSSSTYVPGLRGKIAFYYAKNVRIEDVTCTDLDAYIFFIHLSNFENVTISNCTIKGQKDGIHVSRGDGLTIRDCILGTHDDQIALNAHDYIDSCPELGWIRNVLIENCVNEAAQGVTPGSRGILMLGGAWLDWTSGNAYQRGDTVVAQNGYVYRLAADALVDGNNEPVTYTSNVEPNHSSGNQTYSDGITWRCVQHDTMYNAGLENITIRNYTFKVYHDSLFLLNADIGRYSRGVYPGAYASPHKNITIENVTVNKEAYQNNYSALVNLSYPCDLMRISNCAFYGYSVMRAQYKNWQTIENNDNFNILLSGNQFKSSWSQVTMNFAYFQNPIYVICDAVQNYITEPMGTNLVTGASVTMSRDDLLN